MSVMANRQVVLVRRPSGAATEACFAIQETRIPAPGDGDVLVATRYLSVDPYLRGRMEGDVGYAGGFPLGEPIAARAVGEVVESRHPSWKPGDLVWGFLGWQTHSLAVRAEGLYRVDPALGPISHFISVLGMPGLTAWVGMLDIGRVQPGETVVVSAAAGAVGSLAGQLAKLAGARVIGTAGTDEKCAHVTGTLGFDACINYRTTASLRDELRTQCPNGIDVYFDNVGGPTLEAVFANLATFARIPVCGMISGYEATADPGLRGIVAMLRARATMTGFVIYDHMAKYPAYVARMAPMLRDGTVRYHDDIWDGIERTPAAFLGMLRGDNIGKRLVRV